MVSPRRRDAAPVGGVGSRERPVCHRRTEDGGGRSADYERSLRWASETAIGEMVAEAEQQGADAVVGVDVDYEFIQVGQGGSMLKVSASGTAVKL